jgi:hypothetical protein
MLLRLVVLGGLVSGTDVAKFYARDGLRGSMSLEQYLQQLGVDPSRLDAIKRAYAQTEQFGSLVLRYLKTHGADDTKLRAANRALNACETAQLMAIKKGKTAKPIGEMMVELGHISDDELEKIVGKQGMLRKIDQYEDQIKEESSLAHRLGLNRARGKLAVGLGGMAVLVGILVLVVLLNLWSQGAFSSTPEAERYIFGGGFSARDTEHHIRMINQHYANMITELRLKNLRNARHYKDMLDKYFAKLEQEKVRVEDSDVVHIRDVYAKLDLTRVQTIPAQQLPRMSVAALERRLQK